MRLTALNRFSAALAMVPLFAALAFAAMPRMFVCSGDSIARLECCCPRGHDDVAQKGRRSTVSASCCCDIFQMKVPTTPGITVNRETAARVPIALLPFTIPTLVGLFPSGLSQKGSRLAQEPPRAILIRLARQSFQI